MLINMEASELFGIKLGVSSLTLIQYCVVWLNLKELAETRAAEDSMVLPCDSDPGVIVLIRGNNFLNFPCVFSEHSA